MNASKLIEENVLPLRAQITGTEARQAMNDYHLRHLPVVNDGLYVGTLCEQVIVRENANETIAWALATLPRPYVAPDDHVFTVLERMYANQLTSIPVVDTADNHYMGVITLANVLAYFGETTSMIEPGAVIVLEMSKSQYSLYDIARLVESEGISVLSSFVTSKPDSTEIEVTLKVNKTEVQHLIASFDRFGYEVKAGFDLVTYGDGIRENYDALMAYLSI